ncbi:helicase-associated domain-containing protein [Acrocarpospora sp. B8E8]|uniref:helicase-associated domain-containing protein n=1 Tax=Acrocarpospora sp. B8E8 TaxID=3153572 RepID=UPI00325F4190
MSTERHLTAWLKAKAPGELRALLAGAGFVSNGDVSPRDLARLLLQYPVALNALNSCTLPEVEALSAVAWLAARRHGDLPSHYWHGHDPGDRAVPRADVVGLLAGSEPGARADAEAVLDGLAGKVLVLPPYGESVVVPNAVHLHLTDAAGLGRAAGELMTAHFNAPEVHRIAGGLGLAKVGTREVAQRNVLAVLTDQARVRALLADGPAAVREWLANIVRNGARVRTHVFKTDAYTAKSSFRAAGSADANTEWLAARGLLLPTGAPEVAEVPIEVATAVLGEPRARFHPRPPSPPLELPDISGADGSAQAAALAAVSQIDRLIAACAVQPPSVRKSGGLAVRDTKRLAKTLGLAEEITRFWLDLTVQAGLLGAHAEPVPRPKGHRGKLPDPVVTLLPTSAYDEWRTGRTEERLVRIIVGWASVDAIFTYTADQDGPPVALTEPDHPYAVGVRHAVLEALAALPAGKGSGPEALPYLVARATWHRPHHAADMPDIMGCLTATLREAELLGVVARGALTQLGHALLDLLRAPETSDPSTEALVAALAGMLPAPQVTAFFQADLTAVVRGTPEAALADLLDGMAARESEGHAVVWRFSPASVRHALDLGHDATDLLERLAAVAEAPLPQPFEYLIKDVGRVHGRMRVVRSGCCIRSDDETLIDELAGTRALRALGLRKIAPTVLISSVGEAETLTALRAAGHTPVLEAETGATVVERTATRRANLS